jgi:hypothetical protein
MTVEYLVPSANASPMAILATQDYTLINEGSPNGLTTDADGLVNDTNIDDMSGGESAVWALANLAGFGTWNSATFRVRARLVNPGSGDVVEYLFQLAVGGSTYDLTYDTATDENGGFNNYEAAVAEFTEAQYNAATVTLTQTVYNKDMGPDGLYLDIDCFELEVDYTSSTPVTVTPTGVGSTGGVGSVSGKGKAVVQPSGVAATGQVGGVAIAVSKVCIVTGLAAIMAVGSVTVDAEANVPVTGVEATGQVGEVTVTAVSSVDVPVTGVGGTGQVGAVEVEAKAVVSVVGVEAIGLPVGVSIDTYLFDASDAGPTDDDSVWTDDALAFNGDINDGAFSSTIWQGGGTTELRGTGTTASVSGDPISQVRFRLHSQTLGTAQGQGAVYHDAAFLGSVFSWTGWSEYYVLNVPTGGWTWQKVNDLEVRFRHAVDEGFYVHRAEVEVTTVTAGITFSADANVQVTGVSAAGQVGSATASGKAIIPVTGIEATGSVGSVTVAVTTGVDVPVTGVEATGSVGTAIGTVSWTWDADHFTLDDDTYHSMDGWHVDTPSGAKIVTVSGVVATGESGSVVISLTKDVQLTGVEGSSQVGAATIIGDAVVIPTGVEGTAILGSITIIAGNDISVGVSGVQGTGQVGSVGIIGDAVVPVTGLSASGAVGSVTISLPRVATVVGVSATTGTGSASITGDANIAPDGSEASGQVGAVTVTTEGNVTVLINGVSASGEVGSVTVVGESNTVLTGVEADGQVGSVAILIGADIVVPITGVASTGEVGSAIVIGDANIQLSGVEITGSVGSVIVVADANVSLTGIEVTGQIGSVIIAISDNVVVSVAGVGSVGSVGAATVSGQANILLAGIEASGEVGTAVAQTEVIVIVSGVEGIGQVGSIPDQDSATTTILKAMLANLDAIVLSPVLPIAQPGIPEDPPAIGMWLEARFFPNEVRDLVWNNHARVLVKGYLQVAVGWRPSEDSLMAASRVADTIIAGFEKGLEVGPARVKKTPWTSSAIDLPDKSLLPIIIPYMGIVSVAGYDGVVISSGSTTTDIIGDLLARLDTLSVSPALLIAWPGVHMTPPDTGMWLETKFAPTESTDLVWDNDTQKNTTGSLLVMVYYRPGINEGQDSQVSASEIADAVARLYPKGLGVGAVRISKEPWQGPSVDLEDKSYIPVMVPYRGIIAVATA